jgi:hypothetical protein
MWKAGLAQQPPVFWAADIAEWAVLPIVTLWLAHRFSAVSPRDCGLAWPGAARFAALLFFCTLTLFLAHAFGARLVGPQLFDESAFRFDYAWVFPESQWLRRAAIFYLSASAALCESLFLLALPWLWFSQKEAVSTSGKIAFGLTTAFVFMLGHWESGGSVAAGAFTFQLGAVAWYLSVRNLWPIVGAHFLIDLYWFSVKP